MAKKESSFSGWLQRVRRTGEFSDVKVLVEEGEGQQEFRLHMLPLLNASHYFRSVASGSSRVIELKGIPGGAEGFAAAADFCYLIRPCYTLENVAKIRAVAEHLGMAELLDSTKKFLYMNVFSHWRSSIAFLQQYKRLGAAVDGYVEARCVKVISAACTKAFFETKYLAAPISSSWCQQGSSNGSSSSWAGQAVCEAMVRVSSLRDEYVEQVVEDMVGAEVNLNLKCRQGRNVQQWLDNAIQVECRSDRSRCWVVVCLIRMLEKSVTQDRPWLELSSPYWCCLLRHADLLLRSSADDAAMAARLKPLVAFLEARIGGSLHELDDYLLSYSFQPHTLLSLVSHFKRIDGLSQEEISEVASEVDSCLWSFVDTSSVSARDFLAFFHAFPPASRPSHDMLYSAVDKLIGKSSSSSSLSSEEKQRLWGVVDIAKLSSPCRHEALNNSAYVCQSHVLRFVLQQHSHELEESGSSGSGCGGGAGGDLGDILQKVITANLKLLEENTRRAQEIMELQKKYAYLMGGSNSSRSKDCGWTEQGGDSSPGAHDVLSLQGGRDGDGDGEGKAMGLARMTRGKGCMEAIIIPDEVEEAPSDTPARRSTCSSSLEY